MRVRRAAAEPKSGWMALAEAVERNARETDAQNITDTLDDRGVLPAAAVELSPSARKHLEAATEREAPNYMTPEGREATLRGCEKLRLRIPTALLPM